MPDQFVILGPWTLPTYTLAVALGVAASAGIGLLRTRQWGRLGARADTLLGGLVGGVILGRLAHVLLNWNAFAYNLGDAFRLSEGGLDWHGALVGGLAGTALVARWKGPALGRDGYRDLLDALAPALPLLALAGWFGCWAAQCAYGAEVANLADYPPPLVWEGPDIFGIYAPRYHTQALGMLLSVAMLIIALLAFIPRRLAYRRFWLILALHSLGMFGLGFLRGDYALRLAGLRLDQWLDVGLLAVSIWRLAVGPMPDKPSQFTFDR